MKSNCNTFVALLAIVAAQHVALVAAGTAEFWELHQKAEHDVLSMVEAVEIGYERRCERNALHNCFQGNYDACESSFPNPVCLGSNVDGDCGEVWDFSVSSVSVPSWVETSDFKAIESVCYSQALDEFFVGKAMADQDFWGQAGMVSPPWMYFGAEESGVFRIFPARPQESCGSFDPRERNWYIGGSSGPKIVVLVLDVSRSMEGLRLEYMKEAADRIIDTLTQGDMIAIIPFHTAAYELEVESNMALMRTLTPQTKDLLKAQVRDLEAGGSTNIYAAFGRAFEVLEEASDSCNMAILFLTDGAMTDPPGVTDEDVLNFVRDGLVQAEQKLGHVIHLLTYSIPHTENAHDFAQQLACVAPHGVCTKLDEPSTIVDSLAEYYKVFGLSLGQDANQNFTAWTVPYHFSTNGLLGISLSAPAFDRSVEPPKLIGVVGLDLPMSVLDHALGLGPSENNVAQVSSLLSSTAKCPLLNPTGCQLQEFQAAGIEDDDARCNTKCTITPTASNESLVKALSCGYQPTDYLANRDLEYTSFTERAFCFVGPDGLCLSVHNLEEPVAVDPPTEHTPPAVNSTPFTGSPTVVNTPTGTPQAVNSTPFPESPPVVNSPTGTPLAVNSTPFTDTPTADDNHTVVSNATVEDNPNMADDTIADNEIGVDDTDSDISSATNDTDAVEMPSDEPDRDTPNLLAWAAVLPFVVLGGFGMAHLMFGQPKDEDGEEA